MREATFAVAPGAGTLQAPDGRRVAGASERGGDALSRAFSSAAAGEGVLVLLLLTAFAWGALHALSPGHGKAMVAAYLVGTRGTARHAVALGATVTVTHTAGVFALGLVALGLSEYILPGGPVPVAEPRLRPARARRRRRGAALAPAAPPAPAAPRAPRAHHHDHHHDHDHEHGHSHAPPERLSWRGLIAMGASAGLIPCPSALVVLLGAVAQGQIALGMLLIVAFSLGLAATLTGLGLAVVLAGRALGRLNVPSGLATAVPAISALLIVGVGFVLTVQAVPQVA